MGRMALDVDREAYDKLMSTEGHGMRDCTLFSTGSYGIGGQASQLAFRLYRTEIT